MNRLRTLFPLFLIIAVLVSCGLGDKAEQVTQLVKSVEEAQENMAKGDTSGAFGALLGGGESVQPVDFRNLTALLPNDLPGFERAHAGGEKNRVMGMGTSTAEGKYHDDDRNARIDITIVDLGSVRGVGMLGFNWLITDVDKETDQGYERTVTYQDNPAYAKFEQGSDWSRGEMSVFVADRFVVTVDGNGVSEDELRDALDRVDLHRLDAMKDEGVGEEPSDVPDVTDFASRPSEDEDGNSPNTSSESLFGALEAMNDGRTVEPVNFRELQRFLPEDVAGLSRTNTEGETGGAMNVKTSSATGTYEIDGDGSARVTIKIFDSGTLGSAMMLGGYAWLMVEVDKESDQGFERTIEYEGYPAYEKFTDGGSSSQGSLQALVGKRFVVEIEGRGVEMETIRAAMNRIDLDGLEAMKDAGAAPES